MTQPNDTLAVGEYPLSGGITYEVHEAGASVPVTEQQLALASDIILHNGKKLSANFLLGNEPARLKLNLTVEQIQAALAHPERRVK